MFGQPTAGKKINTLLDLLIKVLHHRISRSLHLWSLHWWQPSCPKHLRRPVLCHCPRARLPKGTLWLPASSCTPCTAPLDSGQGSSWLPPFSSGLCQHHYRRPQVFLFFAGVWATAGQVVPFQAVSHLPDGTGKVTGTGPWTGEHCLLCSTERCGHLSAGSSEWGQWD